MACCRVHGIRSSKCRGLPLKEATPTTEMKNPVHVGAFVKHEVVEAHGLTVTGGANAFGVTRHA